MEVITEHWEGIVAVLALLTAAISTSLAFLTFRHQRTHSVKSVLPILQVGQWDYENVLRVDLGNSGLGPARVTEIAVSDNSGSVKTSVFGWLPKKLPDNMNYKEYWTGHNPFVVQARQIIHLIEIPVDTANPVQVAEREKLRAILRQLTVHIEYEDLYGNKMSTKTVQLYHFSRTDHENSERPDTSLTL